MSTISAMYKILTIDDEQDIVDLIADILEANNYQAVRATRWTEALDAINHENPDLVLLDLKMPTIHGIAILEFIHSQGFDIPVIIVSGFVNAETQAELSKYGVRGIIHKPFNRQDLLDEIGRVLSPPQTRPNPDDLQNALNALYNHPPAPEPDKVQGPVSMDALYGANAPQPPPDSPHLAPPDKDILRALEKSTPPEKSQETPPPGELRDVLPKQAEEPPADADVEPTAEPFAQEASVDTLLNPMPKREETPANPYGLREPSRRHRSGRKRLGKSQVLVMSGITIVCIVIAGFLATMQWLSSQYTAADIQQQAQDAISNQVKQELLKELQKQSQNP